MAPGPAETRTGGHLLCLILLHCPRFEQGLIALVLAAAAEAIADVEPTFSLGSSFVRLSMSETYQDVMRGGYSLRAAPRTRVGRGAALSPLRGPLRGRGATLGMAS